MGLNKDNAVGSSRTYDWFVAAWLLKASEDLRAVEVFGVGFEQPPGNWWHRSGRSRATDGASARRGHG